MDFFVCKNICMYVHKRMHEPINSLYHTATLLPLPVCLLTALLLLEASPCSCLLPQQQMLHIQGHIEETEIMYIYMHLFMS